MLLKSETNRVLIGAIVLLIIFFTAVISENGTFSKACKVNSIVEIEDDNRSMRSRKGYNISFQEDGTFKTTSIVTPVSGTYFQFGKWVKLKTNTNRSDINGTYIFHCGSNKMHKL